MASERSLIVGRDAELEQLGSIIAETTAGAKRAVLLIGPAGIGKTTLLRWAHEEARRLGLPSAYVRIPSSEGLPPRYPLAEIIEELAIDLEGVARGPADRVIATLRGLGGPGPGLLHALQLAKCLETLPNPFVLAIDDVHLLEPDIVDLLFESVRLAQIPLVLACGTRKLDASTLAIIDSHWSADLRSSLLELTGLSHDATSKLFEGVAGSRPLDLLLESVQSITLGNPLAIEEVVRSLVAEGGMTQFGDRLGLPPNAEVSNIAPLNLAVDRRLRKLPQTALRVLEAMVVYGHSVTFTMLLALLDHVNALDLQTVLAMLEAEDLVCVDATCPLRYRVAHHVFERALCDAMGSPRVAALHSRIFDALSAQPNSPPVSAAELAHHASLALVEVPNLRHIISAAADEATRAGSDAEAARWYGLLTRASPPGSQHWVEAVEREAIATSRIRPQESLSLFADALDIAAEKDVARLLLARAHARRLLGDFAGAIDDLEHAGPKADVNLAYEIRHSLAVLWGIRGDIARAENELHSLANANLSPELRARVQGTTGHVAFVREDLLGARVSWSHALEGPVDIATKAFISANLVWVLTLLGEWASAELLLERTLHDAVERGDIWTENTLLCSATRLMAWTGRPEASLDFGRRALSEARRLSNPAYLATGFDSMIVGLLAVGSLVEAQKLADELESTLLQPDVEPRDWVVTSATIGEVRLQAGDLAGAERAIELGRHRQLAGDPAREVFLATLGAAISIQRGELERAWRCLRPWLGTSVPVKVARDSIEELTTYLAARLRSDTPLKSEAANLPGADSGARRRGRPRSSLPRGITQRELEVLNLLDQGCSDKEIATILVLSWSTARKHVENVLRKLQVTRRSQAPQAARRIGLPVGVPGGAPDFPTSFR